MPRLNHHKGFREFIASITDQLCNYLCQFSACVPWISNQDHTCLFRSADINQPAEVPVFCRWVSQGQMVIITDRGRSVGRLLPVDQPLDERLNALQDAGLVACNGQKLKAVTPAAVNRIKRQVSDILLQMRE